MPISSTNSLLLSIITVVFNAKETIEQTIISVINQSYNNIEFIIVDGGSTDGTIDIIKKYDNKIAYWISEPDSGIYDAMNKGVNLAKGKYIYFLGAGDSVLDVLDQVAANFSNDNQILYGNVYRTDFSKLYDGKFSPFKLAVKNICHQAIFYPATVFKFYQYNLKYKIQADYELNIRCYGSKNFIFTYLPITIAKYEGGGYSDSNIDYIFFENKIQLIKSNFNVLVYYYVFIRTTIAKLFKLNAYQANRITK
ncbi:MAG: glycosyltransferase family 2 protein [Janthinobacterium lividum]